MLLAFEHVELVLLKGDTGILSRVVISRSIDDTGIGVGILVLRGVVEDPEDVAVDEGVLIGTDGGNIEEVVIADQSITPHVKHDEAQELYLLQTQRQQRLQVLHLRPYVLNVLIVEEYSQLLPPVTCIVELTETLLVNAQLCHVGVS